jgi:hypothetical protein
MRRAARTAAWLALCFLQREPNAAHNSYVMLNGDVVVKPQGLGRALQGGTTASAGADKQQCCKAQYRLAQLVRRCYFAQDVTNGFVRAAALFYSIRARLIIRILFTLQVQLS